MYDDDTAILVNNEAFKSHEWIYAMLPPSAIIRRWFEEVMCLTDYLGKFSARGREFVIRRNFIWCDNCQALILLFNIDFCKINCARGKTELYLV